MLAELSRSYIATRPTKALSRLVSYTLYEGRPLTTRGRWINPFVFANFSLVKMFPQLKKVEKPIFIVGMGRSGSTVLGELISLHRDVAFLNEPKALWHEIYSMEDVTGNYSRGSADYRLGACEASSDVKLNAHKLFGAFLSMTFSKRVVDKYPELIFRIPFVRSIFPDAKFIFLVRHGWDTCASIEKWSVRHRAVINNEVHDWWGVNNRKWRLIIEQLVATDNIFSDIGSEVMRFTRHADMAAVEWVVTMREGMRQMRKNADCIHMVRYEDMVNGTDESLREILMFCELSEDPVFLDYARNRLHPQPKHEPISLHPAIRPLFETTINDLGYSS